LIGQQRTPSVGWNTERLVGVSAAGEPLWFPSVIAINEPRAAATAQGFLARRALNMNAHYAAAIAADSWPQANCA